MKHTYSLDHERRHTRRDEDNAKAEAPFHQTECLADDLLRGAEAIAAFIFGNAAHRRKIYHLAETSRLPVFRLGSVLYARRSVLMNWIAEQEARGVRGLSPER